MMARLGPGISGHEYATWARDEEWRRGFAEPDVDDEDRPPPDRSPAPAAGAFEGCDDFGVITVMVDAAGAAADVVVPRAWRDAIEPRGLGQALLTAANNALTNHLADKAAQLDLTPPVAPVTGGEPPDGLTRELMISEMVELLARVNRDLESYRDRLDETVNVSATASGPGGHVMVTMTPGRVADVTADTRWATRARYTEIRVEALGALRAANRKLGNPDPSSVPEPASITRLRELSRELARKTNG